MLSHKDILILGMTIFALFLGAGNIIFPPLEGFLAGEHWLTAALGFLLTGVLLPCVTLIIVTLIGGGRVLSQDLPKWAATTFWVTLYTVIGPAFAMPRITNVAYEMAFQPLNLAPHSDTAHLIFSIVFNLIGLFFILNPSRLIDNVGKYMTPLLLLLLVAISVSVFVQPLSIIPAPSGNYAQQSALGLGMVSGYQTMDVLAATAFGGIIAHSLRAKNVFNPKMILRYSLAASLVSVSLLGFLYISLFYLGATSADVAVNAQNGGQIFSAYVNALFGKYGVWMMSMVVVLASMTTFVGVITACSDYFASFSKRFTYPFWAISLVIITTVIAEIGLTQLLSITIPALLLIYPVSIMLVFLQYCRAKIPNVGLTYNLTCGVTLIFSAMDSLKYIGKLPAALDQLLSHVPMYADSLAWLLPSLFTFAISLVIGKISRR